MKVSPSLLGRALAVALTTVLAASCAAAPAPPAAAGVAGAARSADGCPAGANYDLCVRSVSMAASDTAARAIKFAMNQVGRPYCNGLSPCGGDSNRFGHGQHHGYDCSGLMWRSYVEAGVDIGAQVSGAQVTAGGVRHPVAVGAARPGDILGHPGHVAMLLADGRIVEAPKPGVGVRIAGTAHRNFTRAVTIAAP